MFDVCCSVRSNASGRSQNGAQYAFSDALRRVAAVGLVTGAPAVRNALWATDNWTPQGLTTNPATYMWGPCPQNIYKKELK